jgi:2-C-methyl-D-erythritol 4-phosphate cytidylyltransferase
VKALALVLAGGSGQRAGLGLNKVLATLGDRTVLERSVDALRTHVDHVIVVARPADRAAIVALLQGRVTAVVDGGATRHDSEAAGLAAANGLDIDVVMIHDGARPLVDDGTIMRVLAEAAAGRAAVPALERPVPVARWPAGHGGSVLDGAIVVGRGGLVGVQTPQAAPAAALRDAFARARAAVDAPASLVDTVEPLLRHRSDVAVIAVAGNERNIKLTWPSDIARAERLLQLDSAKPSTLALRMRAGRPTGGPPVAQLEVDGVTPVTDALRVVRDGAVVAAVDRSELVDVTGDLLVMPGALASGVQDLAVAVEMAVADGARLRLRRQR